MSQSLAKELCSHLKHATSLMLFSDGPHKTGSRRQLARIRVKVFGNLTGRLRCTAPTDPVPRARSSSDQSFFFFVSTFEKKCHCPPEIQLTTEIKQCAARQSVRNAPHTEVCAALQCQIQKAHNDGIIKLMLRREPALTRKHQSSNDCRE